MECLLTLFVLAVLVVLVSFFSQAQGRSSRRNLAYRRLAERVHGNLHAPALFGYPHVYFRYRDAPVMVQPYSVSGVGCTRLEITWPDPGFCCEVLSRNAHGPSLIYGLRELSVASEPFASGYLVRGHDPAAVRQFLSPGVQWQIQRLYSLLKTHELQVAVSRGRLLVQKATLLENFADLEQFTLSALELYDQALLTQSEGIEFLDQDAAQPLQQVLCPICGEAIVLDMVFCRQCKTAHHHECWQYNGSCAIYACQETRFVVPRIASPTSDGGRRKRTKPR